MARNRDAQGRRLHLKLYMAGIRVPIGSFSMSASANNHLQAQIEIPPIPLVTKIQPRTVVHVFFKESTDDAYQLLFEGEYVTYSLNEETGAKGFTLLCVGLTNYWETVWQYFLNKLSPAAFGEQETAVFASGGSLNTERSISSVNISLPKEIFGDYVVQALIRNGNDIQQAILNTISLMANMSGGQNGNILNPRINSQIERSFVNLRLGERVFVLPDEAVKRLINAKAAQAVLYKISGTLSDFSTLTNIVQAFLGFVYYDWVPIAAPSYTSRNKTLSSSGSEALDFFRPITFGQAEPNEPRSTVSSISSSRSVDTDNVQRDVVFKPKTYYLPPPTCNLVFPGQYTSFQSTRAWLQEPTRLRLRTHPLPGADQKANAFNVMSYYAPPELKEALTREKNTSFEEKIRAGNIAETATGAAVIPDQPIVKRYETLVSKPDAEIDENVTGVIPAFEELGFAEYSAIALRSGVDVDTETQLGADNITRLAQQNDQETPTDTLPDDLHKYLANVAQYKLDLHRAAQRSVSGISGPFNPNLVVGFPALVFSKTTIFAGEIVNVNHAADARGSLGTTFTLGYVRELSLLPATLVGTSTELALLERALIQTAADTYDSEDQLTSAQMVIVLKALFREQAKANDLQISATRVNLLIDGFDPKDKFPDPPEWISEAYRPDAVAGSVYKPLFGSNVGSSITAAGIQGTNQVLAANVLFIRYLLSSSRVDFVDRLTSRNIATASQVMKDFLGLGVEPSEEIPSKGSGAPAENLTTQLPKGETTTATKQNAPETIVDPYTPFLTSQIRAVQRYAELIKKSRGIRG